MQKVRKKRIQIKGNKPGLTIVGLQKWFDRACSKEPGVMFIADKDLKGYEYHHCSIATGYHTFFVSVGLFYILKL